MEWAAKMFGGMDPELLKRLTPQQRQQIGRSGLLDAGLAMLANSGYSTMPSTLGQIVAGGAMAGRQGAQNALGQSMGFAEMLRQEQEAKAAKEAQEAQRRAYAEYVAKMPEGQRQMYMALGLDKGREAIAAEAKERAKPEKRSQYYAQATDMGLEPGSREHTAMVRQLATQSRAPVVNVSTGAPNNPMQRIVTPEQRAQMGLPANGTYVWDSKGMPQLVEGTGPSTPQAKAEIERAEAAPKAAARTRDSLEMADRVLAASQRAKGMVGPMTTGIVAQMTRDIGGTPARNLQGQLDLVKANLGFQELQKMRENSPTGGALGGIAVKELDMLQSTIASLDQLQDDDQVAAALDQVEGHLARWREAVQKDYEMRYGQPRQSSGWRIVGVE